jgi:NADH-quinone oxidoreductase subunit J
MNAVFLISAGLSVMTTLLAITRANPVHGLLFMVLSLLSMAGVFFSLGAPFAAALEVIIYAGAIMVLFLFVVMMLSLDKSAEKRERSWMSGKIWLIPVALACVLATELGYVVMHTGPSSEPAHVIDAQMVGASMLTTYLPAVELASMLLMAALFAAYHLGRVTEPVARNKGAP